MPDRDDSFDEIMDFLVGPKQPERKQPRREPVVKPEPVERPRGPSRLLTQYAEYMHPAHANAYREFNWSSYHNRDGEDEWNKLRDDIAANGFEEPAFLHYNPDTGNGYFGEGNHRIGIAQELNIPVPVVVYRTRSDDSRYKPITEPGKYRNENQYGHSQFGQYEKPSTIGLPIVDPNEPLPPREPRRYRTKDDREARVATWEQGDPEEDEESANPGGPWRPGRNGKGWLTPDGQLHTWETYHHNPGHVHRLDESGIPKEPGSNDAERMSAAMVNGYVPIHIDDERYVHHAWNETGRLPQETRAKLYALDSRLRFPRSREGADKRSSVESARMGAQTRIQLLQQAQQHEVQHGPDTAESIHTWPDGWSVRRLRTYADMEREGTLMGNCFTRHSSDAHRVWGSHPQMRVSPNAVEYDDDPGQFYYPRDYSGVTNFDHSLPENEGPLYSLRDPHNIPHVSIDPQGSTPALGRHNAVPKDEYSRRIEEWQDAAHGPGCWEEGEGEVGPWGRISTMPHKSDYEPFQWEGSPDSSREFAGGWQGTVYHGARDEQARQNILANGFDPASQAWARDHSHNSIFFAHTPEGAKYGPRVRATVTLKKPMVFWWDPDAEPRTEYAKRRGRRGGMVSDPPEAVRLPWGDGSLAKLAQQTGHDGAIYPRRDELQVFDPSAVGDIAPHDDDAPMPHNSVYEASDGNSTAMYHLTPWYNREAIREYGLEPGEADSVFVSPIPSAKYHAAHPGQLDTRAVNVDGLDLVPGDPSWGEGGEYSVRGHVGRERVTLHTPASAPEHNSEYGPLLPHHKRILAEGAVKTASPWRAFYYHISPIENREAIQAHGLILPSAGSRYIWLFSDLALAERFQPKLWGGSRTNDIWRVNSLGIEPVPDPHGMGGAFIVDQPIPRENLDLLGPHLGGGDALQPGDRQSASSDRPPLKLWHGTSVRGVQRLRDQVPIENAIYATSDRLHAKTYGDHVVPVSMRFRNPLELHHERGKSWRDKIESTLPGDGDWFGKAHANGHDGIIYHWPSGSQLGDVWGLALDPRAVSLGHEDDDEEGDLVREAAGLGRGGGTRVSGDLDAGQRVWTPDGTLATVHRFYTTLPGKGRAVVFPVGADTTDGTAEQHHDIDTLTPETHTGVGEAFGPVVTRVDELTPGDLLYSGSMGHTGQPNVKRVLRIEHQPNPNTGFTWHFVNPAQPMSLRLPGDREHFTWDHELADGRHRRADDLAGGAPEMVPTHWGSTPHNGGGYVKLTASAEGPQTSWHLTDNEHFALDPEFAPHDNTFSISDRSGRKGLYTGDPAYWRDAHDYVRPFVAEIEHPPADAERWGGEGWLPAEMYPQSQVKRVIPYDAWADEYFYKKPYTGPDAREMTPEQVAAHKRAVKIEISNHRPHMLGIEGKCPACGDPDWLMVSPRMNYADCKSCGKQVPVDEDVYQQARYGSVTPHKAASVNPSVPSPLPPQPGATPIPDGMLRFYHYTYPDNIESIRQHGLLYSKGRGDSGTGADEPSKGVWASNRAPDGGHLQRAAHVEFYLHPEQVGRNAEHFWHEDPVEWNDTRRLHHIIVDGDVPPHQIVAIHEPWQQAVRYMAQDGNPGQYAWVKDDKGIPAEYHQAYDWLEANGHVPKPEPQDDDEEEDLHLHESVAKPGKIPCLDCDGTGGKEPRSEFADMDEFARYLATPGKCQTCHGTGVIEAPRHDEGGMAPNGDWGGLTQDWSVEPRAFPGPMRQGNILDPVRDTLDPAVFDDLHSPAPQLRPALRHWLLDTISDILRQGGYEGAKRWASLYLTGSLTTYQYSDKSDCDVSIFVNHHVFPEWSRGEMIGLMVDGCDGLTIPGTTHELQVFVVAKGIEPSDLYKPGLRSGYDLMKGAWIVPPERERAHDPAQEDPEGYSTGLLLADKMDRLLTFEPSKAVAFYHQLHRKRMADQKAGKGDYAGSNLAYKMLSNRGLFERLKPLGVRIAAVS